MIDRPAALAAIGRTPIARLARLTGPEHAEVWIKLESANPTGSYKDRMALAMIEGARARGALQPGQAVVEFTGGSTGSSLAFVCSVLGHPLHLVSATCFAIEKIKTMRAFGAEVELIDSPEGITPTTLPRMRERAHEIIAETGAYPTNQFGNADMVEGYAGLGHELIAQVPGRIDAYVGYVGTAGCFLGVTRVLREANPGLLRYAVEPAESAVLSGGAAGTHRIEGGGVGFRPPLLGDDDLDGVLQVSSAEAFAMARKAARVEGLWSGPSTGANLVAAIEIARRLGPGHRVATVLVDSGQKYLAGDLYA